MSTSGSVTYWLRQLVEGDRGAARPLWERYFRLLVERARQRLRGSPRGAGDEEDVALAAFDCFCRAAAAGRFPRLDDRNDLWQILLRLTDNKAIDHRRREGCGKRGGGKVLEDGAPAPDRRGDEESPLARLVSREPSPEFAALLADECRRLFGLLRDPELEEVARLKMAGHSTEEIGERLGCSSRSVRRGLLLIRRTWREEAGRE